MDHQNNISKLCKNSKHVLKLQIDQNIKELLLKELKDKEKITLSTETNRNFNMKVVYLHICLVIIHFNYFVLKSSQLYSIIPTYM